jgi:hypothetical protein
MATGISSVLFVQIMRPATVLTLLVQQVSLQQLLVVIALKVHRLVGLGLAQGLAALVENVDVIVFI